MNFIDIHTHKKSSPENVTAIYSLSEDEILNETPPENSLFTAGLHPWWICEHTPNLKKHIQNLFKNPNCVGLGEIGLDRAIATPFEIQKDVFLDYLELTKTHPQKPIFIHCVRSYSDILEIFKSHNIPNPIIFHDYNGNLETTLQLLKHKNFYFSVGKKIFNPKTKISQSIQEIPIQKLFLETDDQDEYPIKDLYKKYSEIKNMKLEEVIKCINANFHQTLAL